MKLIVVILNVLLLSAAIILALDEVGIMDISELLLFSLFLATPVLSLVYIARSAGKDGWLSLYFERKRLEEKKKIEDLKQ